MDTKWILEQTRNIKASFQEKREEDFSYDELCERLANLVKGDSFILSSEGNLLGGASEERGSDFLSEEMREKWLSDQEVRRLEELNDIFIGNGDAAEMIFPDNGKEYVVERYHAVIPICIHGVRLGNLWLNREKEHFSEAEIMMGEYTSVLLGLEMDGKNRLHGGKERKRRVAAQQAYNALTVAERNALRHIFESIQGNGEVQIVASKTAEVLGIGRTTVANAISKSAGAGMIQTYSCGAKGTCIRILNESFRNIVIRI